VDSANRRSNRAASLISISSGVRRHLTLGAQLHQTALTVSAWNKRAHRQIVPWIDWGRLFSVGTLTLFHRLREPSDRAHESLMPIDKRGSDKC
jgi:hypothetical protein